ncbi:hypothetical protein [Nocardioides sp. GCM10030258]|uniref:hypothetical protein n=1 Tax=unclassified Nocardioides TaxID=2615069 RepID=UPI00360DAB82
MKRWIIAVVGALSAAPVVLVAPSAHADHIYEPYPRRGYVWFAAHHDLAIAYVASTSCNNRELETYDLVRQSTVNDFPTRWPSGIRMSRQNCTGAVNASTDIKLSYEPASNFIRSNGSSYGGYNVSNLAPATWCRIWAKPHPCGTHISIVHLNNSRFGSSSTSFAYRRRLIMHETGHSFGLSHHCSGNSIMNDGTSSCNGGAFTNIDGYQSTDNSGIRKVYPNWMY